MNLKFWDRKERRQAEFRSAYTDAITGALQAAALGGDTEQFKTAAIETCAGLWSRAFSSAGVEGTDALSRRELAVIGRRLAEFGESVYSIEVVGGRIILQEASDWDITGRYGAWRYQMTLADPSAIRTVHRPQESVLHFQYATSLTEPWRGEGPIAGAGKSKQAHTALEKSIKDESSRSTGAVVPVPDVDRAAKLQGDIKDLAGKTVLVPSTVGGWDQQPNQGGRSDWDYIRSGPEFTAAEVAIRLQLADGIASSCGVPPALIRGDADGTGLREAWRQFLHATIQPAAGLVSEELSEKLETKVKLSFDDLFASDLSGRARAFQSMVGGGMEVEKAAALAGLMEMDSDA